MPNDLLQRVKAEPFFQPIVPELDVLTDASTFIGRSPQIVQKLVETKVAAALARYQSQLDGMADADLKV